MLSSKVDLNFAGQSQPYFLIFERSLVHPTEVFTYKLDYEYGYILRRIIAKYTGMVGTTLVPDLFIECFDPALGQAKQTSAYPLPLITTQNNGGFSEIEVSGQLSCKSSKTSEKILNYYYAYGSTIRIDVTGGGNPIMSGYTPTYPLLWLMLDGYYVPEKSLATMTAR
jgi:hypothetical protein